MKNVLATDFMGGTVCASFLNTLLSFRIGVRVGAQANSASSGRFGLTQIAKRCMRQMKDGGTLWNERGSVKS